MSCEQNPGTPINPDLGLSGEVDVESMTEHTSPLALDVEMIAALEKRTDGKFLTCWTASTETDSQK